MKMAMLAKSIIKLGMGGMSKLPITEVYRLIDGERTYQNEKFGIKEQTLTEDILLLQGYATKIIHHWIEKVPDDQTLGEIRKLAAVAVRTMEHYGAPER